MTSTDALIARLKQRWDEEVAKNTAPYDRLPLMLSTGELALIVTALVLLSAVRHAVKE